MQYMDIHYKGSKYTLGKKKSLGFTLKKPKKLSALNYLRLLGTEVYGKPSSNKPHIQDRTPWYTKVKTQF